MDSKLYFFWVSQIYLYPTFAVCFQYFTGMWERGGPLAFSQRPQNLCKNYFSIAAVERPVSKISPAGATQDSPARPGPPARAAFARVGVGNRWVKREIGPSPVGAAGVLAQNLQVALEAFLSCDSH